MSTVRLWFTTSIATILVAFAATDAFGQTLYSFDTNDEFLAPATTWSAWQDMLDRHESELPTLKQCVADAETCPRRLKGLRHLLLRGADLTLDQQVRLVNRYINRQRYVDDRISSKSEAGNQFETLSEFLHSGGDCEDFAIAKYFVLRELGVAADDMRIVVGKESQRAEHHAMLAINTGSDVLLLENDNRIYKNGRQEINRFVYAVNESGIWDHERKD